jgi:predicted dehydrogenase
MNRRTFLQQAGSAAIAVSAVPTTAQSYKRILGANDRIRLAQLGCGDRSHGHVHMAQRASEQTPVEMVAVCDLWSLARERRAAQVEKAFGQRPAAFQYHEQLLERKDIDGVMIATADFQHARLCADVVRSGKDCYVEKPFANTLEDAKLARDAAKSSKQIVQVGTQHRSQPYPLAVRDIIRSGRIGKVVKISQEWDVNMPRWRGRSAVKELRAEDTDWKRWLLGKPERPFDPRMYLEFRLYRSFSSGIFDQWLSHAVDLVHMWTDSSYPLTATANGGVFCWNDGRENPDTVSAVLTYPQGFLLTYTTTLGNSYRSFTRIQGTQGTIDNFGGEGASLFLVTREGGPHEPDPASEVRRPHYLEPPTMGLAGDKGEIIQVAGAPVPDNIGPSDDDVPHLRNWLDAMRTRSETNATVDHGFSQAVACIMATEAYWSGRRLRWDAGREELAEG